MSVELKRDIYNKLLAWKSERTGKVLEVSGARQVGKTFILKKFARENYGCSIYINMTEDTGKMFLKCLDAFGRRHIYENISLFGESDHRQYDELREYFEVYLKIGGYPEVVKTYLEKRNVKECLKKLEEIIQVFIMESTKYFGDPLENEIFRKILSTIAIVLLKDKKGMKDLVTDFSKIIFKEESNKLSKRMIHSAMRWLYLSHQIGYADKSVDCDYLNLIDNCRFYYQDVGIANYFLTRTGAKPDTVKGVLCENYVYLTLLERLRNHEIAGANPWFATYERTSGELDFYCRSLLDYKNYGLEVKAGNNAAKTANALLEVGKLEYIYNLKDTYGTREGRKLAVPNYLAGRISFSLDM